MKKKMLLMLLIFALFMIFPHKDLLAEDINNVDSIIFTDRGYITNFNLNKGDGWRNFVSAVSSDENIADIYIEDGGLYVSVFGKMAGSCNLTITDENNRQKNIKVTVTNDYCKRYIDLETRVSGLYYGSRRIRIDTIPNSSVVLKIRKDTYKFTVGKSGQKTIKLKRTYRLNEKTMLTLKKNGVSFTTEGKIESATTFILVEGSKKKLGVKVWNLHKGDIIKIWHRGKTYIRKIKKNYDQKTKYIYFKTKKKVRRDREIIKVVILNKSKKKLDTIKVTLYDGIASTFGEDEDMYSD